MAARGIVRNYPSQGHPDKQQVSSRRGCSPEGMRFLQAEAFNICKVQLIPVT